MDAKTQKRPTTPPASSMSDDITSSVSSEVFESWTLVSDKNKAVRPPVLIATGVPERGEEDSDGSANHVEILNSDREDSESSKTAMETPTKGLDDLSDGISVITDSESELRNPSPNSALRFSITDIHEVPPTAQVATENSSGESHQLTRLRRRRSSDPSSSTRSSVEVKTPKIQTYPALRFGITGLFYVGVLLAILGFVGKLRYPEWDTSSKIEAWEAKLNDLEMQNNLMRAEVDILTKQVSYLASLGETQRYKSKDERSSPRKEQYRNNQRQSSNNGKKPFKIGPGEANLNGHTDIWNEEQVQCVQDKVYNEIAGVCVDRLEAEIPISEPRNQNTGGEMGQNFQKFEDKLHKLQEKFSNGEKTHKQGHPSYSKDGKKYNPIDKENIPLAHNFEYKNGNYPNTQNGGKYNSKKGPEKNNHIHGSDDIAYKGNKFDEHNHRGPHKHYDDDDSRERFDHHPQRKNGDSRERFDKHRQQKYQSRENRKHKHQPSHPKFDVRQGNDDNWFIARGDGREQARFTGHRRR